MKGSFQKDPVVIGSCQILNEKQFGCCWIDDFFCSVIGSCQILNEKQFRVLLD